ncbi:SLC13 family permease [Desulfosporosinus sp. OT]|uniref:SLC13 family permease n=1 Tax=Desulfosporosinus sp. OT TaxID=913865 RepID=UPI000223A75F|nr:SLC13 family permease [Desulfosporosinus sp. OT]EGW39111.1 citrate transporter family protein [Desulfosporosinus sp. OT]
MTVAINSKPKKNVLQNIHIIIGLLLMFGFGMLPPYKQITASGMHFLGIFLGLIYLWSTVSRTWPSLLGILAVGISSKMDTVLLNAFGNTISVQLLFVMILFGAIQQAGVNKYISRWFLTRKIINGRPLVFSFVFLYAAYFISAIGDVLPALILMWSILYSILDSVGYTKGDKYTSVMVIGTFFATISGQAAKPFTSSALMIVGAFEKVAHTKMDYLPYMLFGFIIATLSVVLYSLLIKFVFKPDVSKIANINIDRFKEEELPAMNLQQKILFGCLFGYMLLILAPSLLPKTIGFVSVISKMGAFGVVIGFVTVLNLVKIKNKPILDFREIASKHVIWDVYLVVSAAMVASSYLISDPTGIKPFLTTTLNPVLGNPGIFSYIVIIFAMFTAQLANHGAMGVLLMPIMYTFAVKNGSNPMAIATVMTFALHVGIMTPAASPFAAMLYGNKDWVEVKDITKYGSIMVICSLIMYLIVAIPLVNIIF